MREISPLGVVIVTYQSAGVIGGCLESLLASSGPAMRIVVVDNASTDSTRSVVGDIALRPGQHDITIIAQSKNLGFAAGVNRGLAVLQKDPRVSWYWMLNPDCRAGPTTAETFLKALRAAPSFALMGGRTLYHDGSDVIQSDGGRVDYLTGVCRLINRGLPRSAPCADAAMLDFISGANMIASREFLQQAGPMDEGFFLFYEEVDWAANRATLPLLNCKDAVVWHRAGTSTGSANAGRRASALANYYNYRGRMRFLARHRPWVLPIAVSYALAMALRTCIRDGRVAGWGAFCGTVRLPPPRQVRNQLQSRSPDTSLKAAA